MGRELCSPRGPGGPTLSCSTEFTFHSGALPHWLLSVQVLLCICGRKAGFGPHISFLILQEEMWKDVRRHLNCTQKRAERTQDVRVSVWAWLLRKVGHLSTTVYACDLLVFARLICQPGPSKPYWTESVASFLLLLLIIFYLFVCSFINSFRGGKLSWFPRQSPPHGLLVP